MALPTTMRALKTAGQKKMKIVDVPLPSPPKNYILVKVKYICLNPTDWKHVDDCDFDGLTIGCDFSGEVFSLGSNLEKQWSVGDRVAGVAHGQHRHRPESGGFAEYVLMMSTMGLKLSGNMSDMEASTLGVGVITVGHGLFQILNLPLPDQALRARPGSILIYGGSTATGLMSIQMAKLAGWRVLATCSPHNFDKCREIGADAVFDYHDPVRCATEIRAATDDQLFTAFDCISEGKSSEICANALSSQQGRAQYVAVLPYEEIRTPEDLWQTWLYAYTTFGDEFEDLGSIWSARPDDHSFMVRFWGVAEQLIAQGKIKTFPALRDGGLEGVAAGFDDLRKGTVSGCKLVYKI